MTNPVTQTTIQPVKTKFYVKAEGGAYNKYNVKTEGIGLAYLGGEITKGGAHAKAELGYGTGLGAAANAGYEFNLGKNVGLDLAANAEYYRSNTSETTKLYMSVDNQEPMSLVDKNNNGYFKAGGQALFNFKGKRANVKAGVEVGYRRNGGVNMLQSISVTKEDSEGNKATTTYGNAINTLDAGAYVTPKISAELLLDKKGHWSAIADADMYKGSAGIKYIF